ncbi:uncharacterized protein B0H18DRAFT_974853 [Fomitopsis serialis]|uniref:uncharacterized protein n=1 Tax=Fomitopsis serialis TaxID=139415 RepID=UPI002008B497|nr:uncharacterized protein B0H18DRAFT_974853 [Neoantrodia serialis]KAH9936647.1 hypothetical protein B0H18DRAFT_974853 [Neoantrodia serialis]
MLATSTNCVPLRRAVAQQRKNLQRAYHDLVALPKKGPIVSYGPPGRSATTGHVATVFGCTGFLGRYTVAKLAKAGTQVVIPYREEDEKRHLKPMGDLGQIVMTEWDLRRDDQIEECLRHSDIVYNLVGRDTNQAGVPRFVHVSHLNAAHDSPSAFYKSKARGDDLVREAFPDATIVRPAIMFGYEDRLLNNMALWPIWWKLNNMATKIRPVHVFDVAQALANLISVPSLPGVLNLPGPSTLTYEYLLTLVSSVTYNPHSRAPVVPKPVALALARAAQAVWWPALSPDEVVAGTSTMLTCPATGKVGVVPDEIEQHAISYLRRYRSAENFTRPVVFPSSRDAEYGL